MSSQTNVRVRFAPSPTGLLHLGGLRTALFNYLFARSNNGKFILRIEDTDQVLCMSLKSANPTCLHCYRQMSSQTDVRVRFAPSATGLLHLGGLRTALFNYLFARSNNGKFILRIEDTDQYHKLVLCMSLKSANVTCLHYYRRMSSQTDVRVRFAPSPTGLLHLGGLRTALFNYLFARSNNGKFILRIEDTDQERRVPGAIEKMEEILSWTGLNPDEGPSNGGPYGPYIQSQRIQLYKEQVDILLKTGHCYKCFCTQKRLSLMRKKAVQHGEIQGYDNKCRDLTQEEIDRNIEMGLPYTIRFKYEAIKEPWHDLVYGTMLEKRVGQVMEGDFIIMKADGYPTYHFANVVDDHFMKISHVFRGEEWSISTPKHLQMYDAFGWTPPKFAHLPLILNPSGGKMSKRSIGADVEDYRNQGLEPDTVLNYVTTISGGFIKDTDGLSLKDMVPLFSTDKLVTHASQLQPEKLKDLNREHLKHRLKSDRKLGLIEEARVLLLNHYVDLLHRDSPVLTDESIEKVLELYLVNNRIHHISELVEDKLKYYWIMPDSASTQLITEIHKRISDPQKLFSSIINHLENTETFEEGTIKTVLSSLLSEYDIAQKDLMFVLRHVLTNTKIGPPLPEVMILLGRQETIRRLNMYLDKIESQIEHVFGQN